MKKLILSFFALGLFLSSAKPVDLMVYNKLEFDRSNELVEFCLCSVESKLQMKQGDKIIILDENKKQIPYQILSDMKTVVFPASVMATDSVKYQVLVGKPDSVVSKTSACQLVDAKGDFAWENDRIAFRMYGPTISKEHAGNGVDVWLKASEALTLNKLSKDEPNYYKVLHTLGAGAVAPYQDKTFWVGNPFVSCQVMEKGPLRTSFKLTYDTLHVGKKTVKETMVVTIDAGQQLNKATVVYEGDGLKTMPLVAGLFLHDSTGVMVSEPVEGYIAYAENAVTEAGVSSGRMYTGVILPEKITEIKAEGKHLLALTEYSVKRPFVYYFGAGSSMFGFPTDKDWDKYMSQSAERIKSPMEVSVK